MRGCRNKAEAEAVDRICGALKFNVGLTMSFIIVGIWPASKETAPVSVKGPPQIRAAWLGGQ